VLPYIQPLVYLQWLYSSGRGPPVRADKCRMHIPPLVSTPCRMLNAVGYLPDTSRIGLLSDGENPKPPDLQDLPAEKTRLSR
jgi:hypothetical protein